MISIKADLHDFKDGKIKSQILLDNKSTKFYFTCQNKKTINFPTKISCISTDGDIHCSLLGSSKSASSKVYASCATSFPINENTGPK